MRLTLSLCAMVAGLMNAAQAQTTDTLTIGVMGDQSGVVSDVGGKVLGKRIELIVADHQNKPDIASSIARRWFDSEGVEAIVDLPHTGSACSRSRVTSRSRCWCRARRA
jgi:branched-chain amino acid transport system substrate-binding protein